ncbi:major facilitator superfamily domain containing protein 5 [Metarhizium album ARSEF 1941]|uniref:Molybdate-anion transporter n=1 Tax=Metarhizium album (strain ARSEF 1941) TaxID=1081103 RepID=A0A0B2WDZ9_METAS|nr:major facilitator superfamily domain containing protein 5 [Metarhizium album ARSEF 1941]KHN94101.1 major facilitator superfamily domain containing protein 5 [Metarhizium album ARSEF 1941]
MGFYQANLAVFAAANTYLAWSQHRRARQKPDATPPCSERAVEGCEGTRPGTQVREFQLNFLLPYTLAVAADWLQGPHLYALYKYDKHLSERMVATLYSVGFISGAISAPLVGGAADGFGRKKACVLYCILYMITCLTMMSDNLPILFAGRFTGGVGTTLLCSVFEAWMMSDYHERGLQASALQPGSIFSAMTTISCLVAMACGVLGDAVVAASGTRIWPFIIAMACCCACGTLICLTWRDNFGASRLGSDATDGIRSGLGAVAWDGRMLSVGLISCVFEGTMYLFIFFWSASLQSARNEAGSSGELPFGLIFSNFMCAMMAGSALAARLAQPSAASKDSADVVLTVVLLAACALATAVVLRGEVLVFWAFCLLEACIGAYFPAMASLKSELVEDKSRAMVYSILRFPLNVFVVVGHSLDQEGSEHRNKVFLVCSALLVVSVVIVRRHLVRT